VLGPVGRDAQQHIRAEHVEQKNEVKETGKVEHRGVIGVIHIHDKIIKIIMIK